MMVRGLGRAAVAVAVLMVIPTACTDTYYFRIRDGSTKDSLVVDVRRQFGTLRDARLPNVGVWPCPEERDTPNPEPPLWIIHRLEEEAAPVQSITYGTLPEGYETVESPDELRAGECYYLSSFQGMTAFFRVAEDGSIIPLGRDEALDSVSTDG